MSKNSLRWARGAKKTKTVFERVGDENESDSDDPTVRWRVVDSAATLPVYSLTAGVKRNALERAARLHRMFVKKTNPYGGNGSLRPASLDRCFDVMGLRNDDVFMDLGAGPGNVLWAALLKRK
jgi:hypothetical protein